MPLRTSLVSARSGEGLRELCDLIAERSRAGDATMTFRIPHDQGAAVALLHARCHVFELHADDDATMARARVPRSVAGRLRRFVIAGEVDPVSPRGESDEMSVSRPCREHRSTDIGL